MSASTRPAEPGHRAVLRFLGVGGANTAVTTVAFYLLSFALPPVVAFPIVYAAGILFVTVVTPRFVFRTRPARRRRGALAAWYVLVLLVGLGVTALLDGVLDLPHEAVVLGTVAVTAPLGFLGSRAIVGTGDAGTLDA
jgi:putative flippase GtrA